MAAGSAPVGELIHSVDCAAADKKAADATSGTVAEPITLANANAMSAAGEAFIAASETAQVRLDMRHVEATSVAVAVALSWLASAQRHGRELCLSNLSTDFSGVVEFSGIASMFAEHIGSSTSA